ncbi:RNA polymerase sigma factor [Gordonia insulae]|uniref:RNA polymerase sigma factor n=1 Tax=Gordonia insulae TaxID=2420509 RepID=A0A3G8JN87_9ACTN|nr:RNA polymerase sigma factor [Gordonia insulae]AZG46042.1 putative ECF RNA polymerase sigma factor SigI [Gordonia insulae]
MSDTDIRRSVDAVWRIEGSRIVASLARVVGDVGLAEDLAQEAVAEALETWPRSGVPRNAGAWLTAVAKRRAIDGWRRQERLDDRYQAIARDLGTVTEEEWEPVRDDVLKLVFAACHPVLNRESQVALTLRVVGGLSTEELARLFLTTVPTVQQRIVRAKKTLSAARVPYEVPEPAEWPARLNGVLGVIYLIFTEGYSATAGETWMRRELADEALRLGRILATLTPREPEVHGLVALMELQASRFGARLGANGRPVLLADQDRRRWDRGQIARGTAALERSDGLGKGRGPYALQAAIAACHTDASDVDSTDWPQIVVLYEALEQLTRNPVVTLNKVVAISMASGPEQALTLLDVEVDEKKLAGSHLLPSVRGELLSRLGRVDEARGELERARDLSTNGDQRRVLEEKIAGL